MEKQILNEMAKGFEKVNKRLDEQSQGNEFLIN